MLCMQLMEEMGVKSQELTLLQQERDKLLAELKESRLEVSRVTESKDDLKRSMARLKTSHAKELDKLHKRLRGGTWCCCSHLSLLWFKIFLLIYLLIFFYFFGMSV